MKRKVIKVQDAPNVIPRFYCPCNMVSVKNYVITDIMKYPDGFKFCPICGAELDYSEDGKENSENNINK